MHDNGTTETMLSICIPTYNRLKYVKELLPIVLRQVDGMPDRLVEVLVSDNCSTDGTADYLQAMERPFLRCWTNEFNIGGDRNFLKCIKEANGVYVWLVGDDELICDNAIRKICDVLGREKPEPRPPCT